MKVIKSFAILALTALAITLWSCGGNSHDHSHEGHEHGATMEAAHGEGKEYTSAYVCPMHCEGSGSDQAGTCPKCGMDYVAQSEHVKDGHKH
ncbi:MAG: hypothetical protein KDC53_08455 [Saprospiraceae bacterium]|nr:hypothetical protein [Saprospiraceae bacterium]